MVLGVAAEEETLLTHVKVEAFQAPVPESNYRILLADITLSLVLGALGGRQPVQNRQPD